MPARCRDAVSTAAANDTTASPPRRSHRLSSSPSDWLLPNAPCDLLDTAARERMLAVRSLV